MKTNIQPGALESARAGESSLCDERALSTAKTRILQSRQLAELKSRSTISNQNTFVQLELNFDAGGKQS